MSPYKAIVFDMDGTLYDLADVVESNFEIAAAFYALQTGASLSEAETALLGYGVAREVRADAKSATELFGKMGFDAAQWRDYRDGLFDETVINVDTAITESALRSIGDAAPIFLLTSNSKANTSKVLSWLAIDAGVFDEVICFDAHNAAGAFSKGSELAFLMQARAIVPGELLSVGDRYASDILPAIQLGCDGLMVKGPAGVGCLVDQLAAGNNVVGNERCRFFTPDNLGSRNGQAGG